MRDKINIQKEEHIFTSDQKLKWFGYGEWVEEVDLLVFEFGGYECMVQRVCEKEPFAIDEHYFGGHLGGYIKIPEYHPYYNLSYSDMGIVCHGGLSFGKRHEKYWVGFDCAHSGDIIPSIEFTKTLDEDIQELKKTFNLEHSPIFKRYYRNIDYVVEQCIYIVEQLKNIAFNAMTKSAQETLKEMEEELNQ